MSWKEIVVYSTIVYSLLLSAAAYIIINTPAAALRGILHE